jgi:hypothetical protein
MSKNKINEAAIAKVIKAEVDSVSTIKDTNSKGIFLEALEGVSDRLAELFKSENPKFDRARFLQACGV